MKKKTQFNHLSQPSFSDLTHLISLGSVQTHQQSGVLQFAIPGSSLGTMSFHVEKVVDTPEEGFVWTGKNTSGQVGYAIFREKDGMKSAFIEINRIQYEIVPLSTTYQAFVRTKKNLDIGGCDLQVPDDTTTDPASCDYDPDNNTCPALIDVLLVVDSATTAEVKARYGQLQYFFWPAEHIVNFAFWNSDIPNKEINVNWVEATEQIADSVLSLAQSIDRLKKFDIDNNIRNNNSADVVFLVTHPLPNFGNSAGRVEAIGPMESTAFGVVTRPGFFGEQIFAHELGHIFGCRHNWGDDDTEVCAHGHRRIALVPPLPNQEFGSGYTWRTLLTTWIPLEDFLLDDGGQLYLVQNRGTILHYSNPEINYQGHPTGSSGLQAEDNAQQIRNTGCEVSYFRLGSTPTVNIEPTLACDVSTYTALVTPPGNPNAQGQPPYYYTWHWSLDGVFNSYVFNNNLFGTTATASLQNPSPVFFVRVSVSSPANGGVFFTRILKINVEGILCDSLGQPPIDRLSLGNIPEDDSVWSVHPNPSHSFLMVNCHAATFIESNYAIIDPKGMTVQTGRFANPNGNMLDIEQLPAGIYHLRIVAQGKLQNIKFIKI